jgi:hypothetical protein
MNVFTCLILLALGLLSSCALERDVSPAAAGPLDSLVRARVGVSTGKVKFAGPVTFQVGGTGNTASSTAVAKAKAPVAAAPDSTATAIAPKGGTPWWVYAGLATLGVAAGFVLRGKWQLGRSF